MFTFLWYLTRRQGLNEKECYGLLFICETYQLKKRNGPPAGLVFGKCPGAGMGALMMLGGRGPPPGLG